MESHCIEMDPGFILLGHSKTCTHGNEGQEEKIYTYRSPETLGTGLHAGPHGEAPGLVKEAEGESGPEPLLWFSREEMGKAG